MSAITDADVDTAMEEYRRNWQAKGGRGALRAALATIVPRIEAARREGFEEAKRKAQTACLLTMKEGEPLSMSMTRAVITQDCTRAIAALKPEDEE